MEEKLREVFQSKLLKAFVSFLLLAYLFRKTDFFSIFFNFKEVKWPFFLAGTLLLPLSLSIRTYNWGLVLNREKRILNFIELSYLNLIALGANLFLPASAGELVKAYYASKLHSEKGWVLISIYLDKLTSLIAVFIIGTFFSFLEGLYYLAFLSFLFFLFSSFLLFVPKTFFYLFRFFSPSLLNNKKFDVKKILTFFVLPARRLFLILFISFLGWLATYFQLFLFCYAFSVKLSLFYLLAISSALVLARLFPLTLNGLGSGEAAFVYFFGLKGVSSNLALLVSLTSQLVNAFFPGLIGLALFYQGFPNFFRLVEKEN